MSYPTTARRRRARAIRHVAVALLITLGAGCGDGLAPERPRTTEGSPPALIKELDESIDAGDSYVMADVEMSSGMTGVSDEPLTDPATGELTTTLSVEAPVEPFSFQSGFTSDGQVVTVNTFPRDESEPDSTDIVQTKLIGTVVTDINARGAVMPVSAAEAEQEGLDPLTEMHIAPGASATTTMVLATDYSVDCIADPSACDDGSSPPPDETSDTSSTSCTDPTVPCPKTPSASSISTNGRAGAVRVELRTRTRFVVVTELDAIRGALAQAAVRGSVEAGSAANVRGRVRREYRMTKGRWILEQIDVEQDQSDGAKRATHRNTMRFRNVRFHENTRNDRARRERRKAARNLAVISSLSVRMREGSVGGMRAQRPLGPSTTSMALVTGSEPTKKCPNPTDGVTLDHASANVRPNVVFQHGIWSNACTWRRMRYWLGQSNYRFGATVASNLPSTDRYDDQATRLIGNMDRNGAQKYVMIGHSNGGIVSRRVGQRRADLVRGVITVNSPHTGVPVMKFPIFAVLKTVRFMMSPLKALCSPISRRGCGEVRMWMDPGPMDSLGYQPLLKFGSVYEQMPPNTEFHRQLNSAYEGFRGVGIVSRSPKKWQWARLWGDNNCYPDHTHERNNCVGGNERATRTNRAYKHFVKTAVLSGIFAVADIIVGDFLSAAENALKLVINGGAAAGLKIADSVYRGFVAPHDDSDAVVPAASQSYPGAERLVDVGGADTHVGATASILTRRQLELLLRNEFNIVPGM